MLERLWRKGNPPTLLMGIYIFTMCAYIYIYITYVCYIYICITESLWCTFETNITLYTNYTPLKLLLFKWIHKFYICEHHFLLFKFQKKFWFLDREIKTPKIIPKQQCTFIPHLHACTNKNVHSETDCSISLE